MSFLVGWNQGYIYYLELYQGTKCGGTDLGTYDGNIILVKIICSPADGD